MSLLPYRSNVLPGTYAVVKCPMCDFEHERVRLHTKFCEDDHTHTINAQPIPHLHRTCANCGFDWLEETAAMALAKETERMKRLHT